MTIYTQTLSSIVILTAVILMVVSLRRLGVLEAEQGKLFAELVTKLTLPATIFHALSHAVLEWKYIAIVLIMLGGELLLLLLARFIGGRLRLTPAQMGSFLLASVFGSSTLLGYAMIVQVFPRNPGALAEAAFISELGVGLPLFTVGVLIAIYYGQREKGEHIAGSVLAFFRSPIFIAIAAGTLWSLLGLPLRGALPTPFFDAVSIVAHANTFLVTLLVGVTLRFDSLKTVAAIAAAAVGIKLIATPLAIVLPAQYLTLDAWQLQVLVIESAMPSAMLSVALAGRYGCDTALASKLIFATLVFSTVSVAMMMYLVG